MLYNKATAKSVLSVPGLIMNDSLVHHDKKPSMKSLIDLNLN